MRESERERVDENMNNGSEKVNLISASKPFTRITIGGLNIHIFFSIFFHYFFIIIKTIRTPVVRVSRE